MFDDRSPHGAEALKLGDIDEKLGDCFAYLGDRLASLNWMPVFHVDDHAQAGVYPDGFGANYYFGSTPNLLAAGGFIGRYTLCQQPEARDIRQFNNH